MIRGRPLKCVLFDISKTVMNFQTLVKQNISRRIYQLHSKVYIIFSLLIKTCFPIVFKIPEDNFLKRRKMTEGVIDKIFNNDILKFNVFNNKSTSFSSSSMKCSELQITRIFNVPIFILIIFIVSSTHLSSWECEKSTMICWCGSCMIKFYYRIKIF